MNDLLLEWSWETDGKVDFMKDISNVADSVFKKMLNMSPTKFVPKYEQFKSNVAKLLEKFNEVNKDLASKITEKDPFSILMQMKTLLEQNKKTDNDKQSEEKSTEKPQETKQAPQQNASTILFDPNDFYKYLRG